MSSKKRGSPRKSGIQSVGEKLLALKDANSVPAYQRNRSPRKQNAPTVSVTMVETDGYSLSRSPSTIKMNIRTAAFFGDGSNPPELFVGGVSTPGLSTPFNDLSSNASSARQDTKDRSARQDTELAETLMMYDKLQVEMAKLKLSINTEQEEQKNYIEFLEGKFEEEKGTIIAAHDQELQECKSQHQSSITEIQEKYEEQIQSIRRKGAQDKVELKREIVHLKECLADTHERLTKENEENMKNKDEKIKQLEEDHQGEVDKLGEMMRKNSSTEILVLREEMMEDHQRKIEIINEEHKREIDDLMAQLSIIKHLEEEALKNNKCIKKLEKKNSRLKHEVKSSEAKQIKIQTQLLETETALANFQKGFETKVRNVESKLRDRLDNLLLENSQLRKKLLAKAEEFCQYKVNVERSNARTIQSFREKMHVLLKARAKAKLGVALGISGEEDGMTSHELLASHELISVPQRPSSAPCTRKESGLVRHAFRTSEATLGQRLRPKSSYPVLSHGHF